MEDIKIVEVEECPSCSKKEVKDFAYSFENKVVKCTNCGTQYEYSSSNEDNE